MTGDITETFPCIRYGFRMLRKLGKYFGWAISGLLALGLVACAVLFLINLKDQPPAPEIAVLQSLQDQDTPITSKDNSYLFVLGFSGPPDTDPMTLGRERHEWMDLAKPGIEFYGDPLIDDYDFRSLRSEAVTELSSTCSESEDECLYLLEASQETIIQWLADEGWLLDRYRALTAMSEFREALPLEVAAPLPSYSIVFEGQRLVIAAAWLSAEAGNAAEVRDALEQDLTYWRMVLRNADTLITKMIATAAIIRHFKLGNLVLRRLPDASKAAGVPPSWRVEISIAERSMRRCLAGEWSFFDKSIGQITDDNENPLQDWSEGPDPSTWNRIAWAALKPFWQHQDISNRYARLMLDLGNSFDVPYEDIPNTIATVDKLQHSAFEHSPRLYNLAGDIAMSSSLWLATDYAVRVSDLEGIRRAALLVAELRADGVSVDEAAQRVSASKIVDPYTGSPFTWEDCGDAIVFQGLERHERSRHELTY